MPLNILLADDSMTAQNMAKKILSEAGYEVTTVSNGAAALKKIADRTPDLAILDIYMPGYTGLEVCDRVKRAAITSSMPVLLSVGKLEPYREQDATDVRADGVIVKPFEATELVTIVTNVILRASGATMDAATRPPASAVEVPAATVAEPESLPAAEDNPQFAHQDSPAQDGGPAVTDSPVMVSSGDYLDTPLPPHVEPDTREESRSNVAEPIEEKQLAMAVSAAPATRPDTAAFRSRTAEADSSMPFGMDELLKADEKVPAEDSNQRFSGPVLDVSPVEHPTEDIQDIEIPAPEPSAGTQVRQQAIALSQEAPAEATSGGTGDSPEELTAAEVEAFMREHAAGAGPGSASAIEVKSDRDTHVQAGARAIAAGPKSSGAGELVPGVDAALALPAEDQAAPGVAEGDYWPVFEAPVFETPVFEAKDKLFISPASASAEAASSDEELQGQYDFEKAHTAADITVQAAAKPAFEPAPTELPAVVAEGSVAQEHGPEPAPASSSPATESEAATAETTEDFMFSVPMMVEAAAAMSLPELPDRLIQRAGPTVSEFAGSSTAGSNDEAAHAATLDEATIAGAVQRVMDRFKPQIVAEIVLELAKHKQ